jgi:predicted MFS family arabinose efflux permease
MQDWKTLLATKAFRGFCVALVCDDLGTWCVIATLPILIAERFGATSALVLGLGIRILPRIVLAPLAGAVLRRLHAGTVAVWGMAATGLLTALLPWCGEFVTLQLVILAIGMLDVFVMPALLTLRTPVTPRGLELAGNTLFFSADRLAKFAGPAIGGLMVMLLGLAAAFAAFAVLMILAAGALAFIPAQDRIESGEATSDKPGVLRDFVTMLRSDQVLTGLLICAVPYMVTFGGMRPFLFWANAEWFGASDRAWTLLLAAQGVGAVVGGLVSGVSGRALQRAMSSYELMLVTSLFEGLLHVALLFATDSTAAVLILILGGVPETLAYATYFTCVQERLPQHRQAVFYALQQPLLDTANLLGVASAALHAEGALALGAWWALLSLFSTLPALGLLGLHARAGRVMSLPP